MLLAGKNVLVTGGTSGIGREIAIRFALKGASVIISGRNEERGRDVIREIEGQGGNAIFIRADLRKYDDIMKLIDNVMKNISKLDVLVNNAGVLHLNYIEDLTLDQWNECLMVNLTAPFLLIKGLIPLLKGGGVIINVSSTAGLSGYPTGAAYCSSKAALIMLTKVAALELAKYGIRVIAIAPGVVDTPLIYQGIPGDKVDEYREVIKERVPLKTIGKPIDIAELVLFLSSNRARYITGSVIVIDGGLTAGRKESGISFK